MRHSLFQHLCRQLPAAAVGSAADTTRLMTHLELSWMLQQVVPARDRNTHTGYRELSSAR